ncbi:MAG: hypothetical protein JWR84_3998 [Caulobacter sp.]|nr:hypothetical protein [Caulobacter sp.]
MIVSLLIGAVLMVQDAPDLLPVDAEHGSYECTVKGVFIHEGALVIRCEGAAPGGVQRFSVEREQLRYADIRDAASWALETKRPLGLFYATDASRSPRGCEARNCRHLIGVELR